MSKSMKALVLAGVLSLAAMSAARANDAPPTGVGAGNGHASAAPACDTDKCPMLAGDGPVGAGEGNDRSAALVIDIHSMMAGGKPTGSEFHASAATADDTGQSVANTTARSGQIPTLWRPVLAGGAHGLGGHFHASAAPACDTEKCPVMATEGPPTSAGDNNGRSMASNMIGERLLILAASKPSSGGNINI